LVVSPLTVAALVCLGPSRPAGAGGSWLSPVEDRYEPGEQATIVGYAEGPESTSGTLAGAPYFGYLRVDPTDAYRGMGEDDAHTTWPFIHPTDVRLGPVIIERAATEGWAGWRIALDFAVPKDLTPGAYEVVICNDPCTQGFGDVIGATVFVGVDPATPIVREWPFDEPAIEQLEDDALVAGPGYTLTAGQIRQGDLKPQTFSDLPHVDTSVPTTKATEAAGAEPEPDVRSVADTHPSGARRALPWIGGAGAVALAFLFVRRGGPGRKQVHAGPQTGSGQRPPGASAWPGRVARP
jgi:hypothetical protein